MKPKFLTIISYYLPAHNENHKQNSVAWEKYLKSWYLKSLSKEFLNSLPGTAEKTCEWMTTFLLKID